MGVYATIHKRFGAGLILYCWAADAVFGTSPATAAQSGSVVQVHNHWLVALVVAVMAAVLIVYQIQKRKIESKTAELRRELFERQVAEKELLASDQKLRQSLAEKEALLKEIHHRVKNNLQIVSSLLYLQEESMQDPKGLEILRESQNRVKSMALIHEQLYGTDNLAKIDFGRYLQSLTANLFSAYGVDPACLRLTIDADDISIGVEIAVPCGLIVNELVSNAIKHAFPQGTGGTIEIIIRMLNIGQMEIVVDDDGVGMAAKSAGSDSPSLGLRLVDMLTTQLDGRSSVETDRGTRFSIIITIPKAQEKER